MRDGESTRCTHSTPKAKTQEGKMRVRCGSEGATEAILDRLVERTIPEHAAKHSSPSNLAEAAVQQVEEPARVSVLDLALRHGTRDGQ